MCKFSFTTEQNTNPGIETPRIKYPRLYIKLKSKFPSKQKSRSRPKTAHWVLPVCHQTIQANACIANLNRPFEVQKSPRKFAGHSAPTTRNTIIPTSLNEHLSPVTDHYITGNQSDSLLSRSICIRHSYGSCKEPVATIGLNKIGKG